MKTAPLTGTRGRQALVAALTLYGVACLRSPEAFRVLDALNLAIHETGHLVFTPFGEFMHFLGGTLLQILLPLLFVGSFARRGDRFAAWVTCWWAAQSLWNVSVYVADARAQLLPLVGGGEHDWAYLLGRLGWLEHDLALSRGIHFAGVALFLLAMLQAWHHARATAQEPVGRVAGTAPAAGGAPHPEPAAEAGRSPAGS